MSVSQFIEKDIRNVSQVFCSLPDEDVARFLKEVVMMDTVSKCRFARLLVCRGDALRLLHLLELNDPDLCYCCLRYLKTSVVRKNLYVYLKNEEVFISLFNSACEASKQVLLECLVWNKKRPEGCLADCLYDNPSLSLTENQRHLLLNACSVEKHIRNTIEGNSREKPYYKEHRDIAEYAAVKAIYEGYLELKKEYSSEKVTPLNKYLPYLRHWWKVWNVNDTPIRTCDLIMDIWRLGFDNSSLAHRIYYNLKDCRRVEVSPEKKDDGACYCALKSVNSFDEFMNGFFRIAPLYIVKKFNYFSIYKSLGKEASCIDWRSLCCLLRNAHLLGEEDIAKELVEMLKNPDAYSHGTTLTPTSNFQEMSEVLSKEEFASIIQGLLENALKSVQELPCNNNIIYTGLPGLIADLIQVVPHSNPVLLTLLDIVATHEKRFKSNGADFQMRFYGLQQKEVPLDFAYQMASKELTTQYSTVRQFEAVLCLKGNTLLNTKEASDRMAALVLLLKLAAQSQDVRVLHRCLNLYTKTELKFNDITLDLSGVCEIFSPDVLGLSEKSAACSGSVDEATKARQGVINTLIEWGSMKKGDLMVKPLSYVMCSLFAYASMYPEFEDIYCQLLEPVVRLLVAKKNNWSSALDVPFLGASLRIDHVKHQKREGGTITEAELKRLKSYLNLERCLQGKASWISGKTFYSRCLTVPCLTVPSEVDVSPMSKKCLTMILNLLNTMEDVTMKYVAAVISKLILSSCVMNSVKEVKTDIEYEESAKITKRQSIVVESSDMKVLRELFHDTSLTWPGQMKGLSLIQSLFYQTNELNGCKRFFTAEEPKWTTTYSIKDLEPKKTGKKRLSLYEHLNSGSQVKRVYIVNHCEETLNRILATAIEKDMLMYTQMINTIQNVAMTQDGLTWCLTTSDYCFLRPLFTVQEGVTVKMIRKILHLTTEANLRGVFKLASLYLHIVLQAAVLATSLNKSDTPVLDAKMVMQIPRLQNVLYDILTVLLILNQEIAYRHLEMENRYITVQCLAPFVASWLQSVSEKRKQTMAEVRCEDSFLVGEVKPTPVTLDVMDNQVIGRVVELMVYSRVVKEFFGKELNGFIDVVSMMYTSTILLICRRMLVVSTFVPYADSLIRRIIASTTNEGVLSEIVDIFFDSSNAITVALMGLVFRVSALPAMACQSKRLKAVISKMTEYVIENDFQSASAYVIIIRWIFTTILSTEESDEVFLRNLLMTISKLDLKEKAGHIVFDLTMHSAFMLCGINNSSLGTPSNETKSFLNSMQTLVKESTEPRQTLLKTILIEMMMQFDTKEDEGLMRKQLSALRYLGVTSISDSLITLCEEILEQQWRPFDNRTESISVALMLLFTTNPERAIAAFTKGRSIIHTLSTMLAREGPVEAESLTALGIDGAYHSYLKDNGLWDVVPEMLKNEESDMIPLKARVEFLSALPDVGDDLAPLITVARALKTAISYPAKEIAKAADATIDIVKMVNELEKTLEPWMYYSLVEGTPYMISFSKKDYMTLFEHFKETKKEVAAVLLCSGLSGYHIDDRKMRDYVDDWIQTNHIRSLYFYSR